MNKVRFIKKHNTSIQEEETTDNTTQNTETPSKDDAQKVQLLNQIAQINKQIADAQKECNDKINQYNQNKVQIQQKLADLGVATNESELFNVTGVSIFESLEPNNKRDILSDVLYDAIENSNLSYTFSKKECDNFARYIMEQINGFSNWDKKENKMDDFIDIVKSYKKVQNKFGSSDSEMNKLLDNIRKSITATNENFSWLIG